MVRRGGIIYEAVDMVRSIFGGLSIAGVNFTSVLTTIRGLSLKKNVADAGFKSLPLKNSRFLAMMSHSALKVSITF